MSKLKRYLIHIGKTEYEADEIIRKSEEKGSPAYKAVRNIKLSKRYWLFKYEGVIV